MTASKAPVLYLAVCAAPPASVIAELVGLLHQEGWTVCVLATPRAAGWLDSAVLANLTGYPVRHDYKQPGDPEVLPPADAIAIVPATFNTINKWAAGISDTFVLGILNEAIGLRVPIVVAPYAKESLAAHPAFQNSLTSLTRWGVTVLENEVIRPKAAEVGFAWRAVLDALPTAGGSTRARSQS
jgi:phosphopantothenoylcysteine synthetase/decarboxylase